MKAASTIVRTLIILLFAYYIAAFAWSVAGRLFYPYELDYFEGSTYLHTQRLIEGEGLYVDPDENFIPYPYTPLYYYFVLPFTYITGQNMIAGRLASLLALAFIGWMSVSALKRETGEYISGIFAFAMFIALYYITGAWLDLCRVDVFLCASMMGTVFFLKDFPKYKAGLLLSAAFLVASVFTKQVGIVMLVFIFPYLYRRDKTSACIYFLGVLAVIAALSWIMNIMTDGWFAHYIFKVPQERPFKFYLFVEQFLWEDVLGKIPILFTGSVLWIFIRRKVSGRSTPLNVWEWTLPAALLASALPRSQPGGFENNLLPLFLWCSIMFGHFIHYLPRYFESLLGTAQSDELKRHRHMQSLIASNFLLAQLILVFFIPTAKGFPRNTDYPVIPSKEDKLAGDQLLEYIGSFPGEVYLPVHNYYGWKAGKTPGVILSSAYEHLKARGKPPMNLYRQFYNHDFDAIILNEPLESRKMATSFERAIQDNYYWAGNIPYQRMHTFLPATGLKTRPDLVFLPLQKFHGIEGRLITAPVTMTIDLQPRYACFMEGGSIYLIDPETFIAERVRAPFDFAYTVGSTLDERLALMRQDGIFLLSLDAEFTHIPFPGFKQMPATHQVAIDPLGEFLVMYDNENRQLVSLDLETGDVLQRIDAGQSAGRLVFSKYGANLYTRLSYDMSMTGKYSSVASIQRYKVINEDSGPRLIEDERSEMSANFGYELRLTPDGEYLFWYQPKSSKPVQVFDAETLKHSHEFKYRGWHIHDIAFRDAPGEVVVHWSREKYHGVSMLDLTGQEEYGKALFYLPSGRIAPLAGSDEVVLFGTGTEVVAKFRIYPSGSWPGEQEFTPKGDDD